MEWVETTGQSVELAKEAALDRLGVDRSEAEFEVLEEAQTGWFGRVKAEARVRARVTPTTPRPKQERRDRGNKKGGGNNRNQGNKRGGNRDSNNAKSGKGGNRGGSGGNAGDGGNGGGGRAAAAGGAAVAAGAGVAAAKNGGGSGDQGSGGGNNAGSDGNNRNDNSGGRNRNDRNNKPSGGKGKSNVHNESDMSVPDQAEVAKTFMEGLLENMGLTGTVGIENVLEDEATVQVTGENVGLLVGPGGRTLNSLQELSRTVIQRHAGGSPAGRIRIDVGGYRARRKEALETFVAGIAAKVIESGNAQALEPMGSADRKIAHDAANGIDGVSTISEGEDPRRRVVIVPAE